MTALRTAELAEILNEWTPDPWDAETFKVQIELAIRDHVRGLATEQRDELVARINNWIDQNPFDIDNAEVRLRGKLTDVIHGVNRSLTRVRERILVDLQGTMTPEDIVALRQELQFDLAVVHVTNLYGQVLAASESLRSFPLPNIGRTRDAFAALVNNLKNDPLSHLGELYQCLKSLSEELDALLGLTPHFAAAGSVANAEIAAFDRAKERTREAVATWRADLLNVDSRAELTKLLDTAEEKLDAVLGQQPKHVQVAVRERWKQARGQARDTLEAIANDTGARWDALLSSEAFKPILDALQPAIDGVKAVLTPVANNLKAIIAKIEALKESLPKELALDYEWSPKLQNAPRERPVFEAKSKEGSATFTLTTQIRKTLIPEGTFDESALFSPPTVSIKGELKEFTIHLIPAVRFFSAEFEKLTFESVNGSKPKVDMRLRNIEFGEALEFVKRFADLFSSDSGLFQEFEGVALRVGYRFALPALPMGGFNLVDLSLNASVRLPFNGDPVRLDCSVSRRNRPFLLTVGILAGGGFFGMTISPQGVEMIEGSMEFGAGVLLNIANVATGRVRVTAGIYFSVSGPDATVFGFVCGSGTLRIIGIQTGSADTPFSRSAASA